MLPFRGNWIAPTAPALPKLVSSHPKPEVVWPVALFLVCVAKAFANAGSCMRARLKMLLNSARMFSLARSLMRNVRPNARFSVGRRWKR